MSVTFMGTVIMLRLTFEKASPISPKGVVNVSETRIEMLLISVIIMPQNVLFAMTICADVFELFFRNKLELDQAS
jgi:hypothetical protein